jgi:hypothetical protein
VYAALEAADLKSADEGACNLMQYNPLMFRMLRGLMGLPGGSNPMQMRFSRNRALVAVSLLALGASLLPAQAAERQVVGKWALNTSDAPNKLHCFKIGSSLAKQITSAPYACENEGAPTGSTALSCSAPKTKAIYIVYDSASDCKAARDTISTAE